MTLTRKQQKEFNRLKSQAEDLWDDQKELFDHASQVVREASRQASRYARQEVTPKVRDAYEDKVAPVVNTAANTARYAANATRDKLVDDVLPTVTSALGTALAAIEVAKNKQVRDAIGRAARFGHDVGQKVGIVQTPAPVAKAGPGRYILIGLGVVAAIAVGYAAYQTLRADDDLWIDDEAEAVDPA